uniref:Uncharacterized protein n=1 Tax=Lutzomyia longipalpis TaxID=7200 RepID=A0A1B0CJY2_LUTLO
MEKPYPRGRPVHPEYSKLGFRRIKIDGKSSVVCEYCKIVLQNTATKRLRGHRNVCSMTPKDGQVKQEEISQQDDSLIDEVTPKEEDPLTYARRNSSSYIELQPPSPEAEYATYDTDSDDAVQRTVPLSTSKPPAAVVKVSPSRKRPRAVESEGVVEVVKQMMETFTGMMQKNQTPAAEYGDEAFCNWLLTQFATMEARRKLRVQHEISNMIFRAQTEDGQ